MVAVYQPRMNLEYAQEYFWVFYRFLNCSLESENACEDKGWEKKKQK